MELSDADRLEIDRTCGPGDQREREGLFLAGMRAGIKRAAKVCDAREWACDGPRLGPEEAQRIAALIRALLA